MLATAHRAENTNVLENLQSVFRALTALKFPVILPLHPRTRAVLDTHPEILREAGNRIRFIEPVSYTETLALVEASRIVVTDSGGLQKEAYWLGTPCVTMTDTNEWIELSRAGCNVVVGADYTKILAAVDSFEQRNLVLDAPLDMYGTGRAADEVVRILVSEARQ